jgi:hypothetical protein
VSLLPLTVIWMVSRTEAPRSSVILTTKRSVTD